MSEENVTLKNGKKIPKAGEKKKRYWWRYLLTFFAGGVFATGVTVGTVLITTSAVKTRDIIQMAGMNPEEILGIDYLNMSIIDTVKTLSTKKFETLGDLDAVSPMIGKTFKERINEILEQNLNYSLDWDELKIKPFVLPVTSGRPATEVDPTESLGDYIPRALKQGITLASFIDKEGTATGIERLFLYPKNGDGSFDTEHPYCINDFLQPGFIDTLKNSIKIGDVVENIDSNPFLAQMKDWGINDFSDTKIKNEIKLGPLFSDMSEEQKNQNPILNAIEDWSIGTFLDMNNIMGLELQQVIDLRTATGLMASLKSKTLNELKTGSFVDQILLGDIFPNAPANSIMASLIDAEIKVGDLDDDTVLLALTVEDFFPNLQESDILYAFRTKKLSEISSLNISTVMVREIFSTDDIEANPFLNALYKHDHDIKFGTLMEPSTIQGIEIGDLYPDATNSVVVALINSGATVGNLETKVGALQLKDVVSAAPNTTLGRIIAAIGTTPLNGLASAFTTLRVDQVIEVDTENPNTPQILITMHNKGTTIDGISSLMNELTAKDIIKIGDENDPLYAIKDVPVSDSNTLIAALKSNLTLKDVVSIDLDDPDTPQVLKSLANVKLNQMESTLKTLTLGQVIKIDDTDPTTPQILKSLKNTVVFGDTDNLETRLINLKFNDYFTETDCSSGVLKALWNSTSPIKGDFLLSSIASKVNDLKLVDILEDKIYESDGVTIKSLWWYLLTEEGETFTVSEEFKTLHNGANYKLNDMDKLIVNMEYHIHSESIYNLIDAGLITVSDPSKLATTVRNPNVSDPTDPNYLVPLGTLSISDAMNTLLAMMPSA